MTLHFSPASKAPSREAEEALVVFNGFSLDPLCFEHLGHETLDLFICGNYSQLDLPQELLTLAGRYKRVSVVAYSLGVWVWSQVEEVLNLPPGGRIMVNGTCEPLHPRLGIPPRIFRLTLENFTLEGREQFYRNLSGSPEIHTRLEKCLPRRTWEDQRSELESLWYSISQYPSRRVTPNLAIISTQDRIIPPGNQKSYWEPRSPVLTLDSGHFPFFHWDSWEEILDAGKHE